MSSLSYFVAKVISKIKGHDSLIAYFRRQGALIGDDTHVFSNIAISEPYLIEIGCHTTISTNVRLITHDASVGALIDYNSASDICGRIVIGNHCFIGDSSIILYGVSIPDNTIVAAGSVVTKSIPPGGVIVAGVPAKVIGKTSDYLDKYKEFFLSLHGLDSKNRKKKILAGKLVER